MSATAKAIPQAPRAPETTKPKRVRKPSPRKPKATAAPATASELRIAAILADHKTHIQALQTQIATLQAPVMTKATWLTLVQRWSGVAALVVACVALTVTLTRKSEINIHATSAELARLTQPSAQSKVDSALAAVGSPYVTGKVNAAGMPMGQRYDGRWELIGAPVEPVATPAPRKSRSRPAVGPAAAGQPASSAGAEAVPTPSPVAAPVPVPDPAGATP